MTHSASAVKPYRYGFRSNGNPFDKQELADFYRRSSAPRQKRPFARVPRPTLSSDPGEMSSLKAMLTHK